MSLIFRSLIFSTIVTLIFHLYNGYYQYYYALDYLHKEHLFGVIILSLVLGRHLGSKLLARHLALWLDRVLSLIEVASVIFMLLLLRPQTDSDWLNTLNNFEYQWITLCASTSLTLLLLLFNLAHILWILYSGRTGRWSLRVQHLDSRSNAGSGPEGFLEALRRLGRALFGPYLLRKRFKFEKTSIRIARGLSAICLLIIFLVAAYDVLVIQPFSNQSLVPTARYFGDVKALCLANNPWDVFVTPVSQSTDICNDVKVYMTWTDVGGYVHNLTCNTIGSTVFQCPSLSKDECASAIFGELFIGTNFTAIALALKNDRRSETYITRPVEFVMIQLGFGTGLMPGYPFPLFPNVCLRATLAVTMRQTLMNIAAFGFQKFQDSYIFNIDKVYPDSNPPISGEIFSSLRIFISLDFLLVPLPGSKELIRDVEKSTILGGTSILGGLWTFMTGIFSLIFGSSLLLVLFGIKPMSVYGFVHLPQGGRVSLAEGTLLTDEEQIQTVAILREHLMDVGDNNAEGLAEPAMGQMRQG